MALAGGRLFGISTSVGHHFGLTIKLKTFQKQLLSNNFLRIFTIFGIFFVKTQSIRKNQYLEWRLVYSTSVGLLNLHFFGMIWCLSTKRMFFGERGCCLQKEYNNMYHITKYQDETHTQKNLCNICDVLLKGKLEINSNWHGRFLSIFSNLMQLSNNAKASFNILRKNITSII